MITIRTERKGNISTALYQLGADSFRVSQAYLGDTPAQLGMTFFKNMDEANKYYSSLTK